VHTIRPRCKLLGHQTMHPDEVYHPWIVRLHIEIANHKSVSIMLPILDLIQFGDYLTGDHRLVSFTDATKS